MYHAVGIVIFDKNGSVWLNLRDTNTEYYPLHWSLEGGHVDEGETPETSAHRELEEETGYKAKNLYFFSAKERLHPTRGPFMSHMYWCEYDGKQTLGCFEGLESKFVSIEELDTFPTVPTIKDTVFNAREARKNFHLAHK